MTRQTPAKPLRTIGFTVGRWKKSRFWAIHTTAGELVVVCVYRKGAREVARRLGAGEGAPT